MERHKILEMLAILKLAGMRAAYDEVITVALKRQHPVQDFIGKLLQAQLADNRARSTAYRMGKARFPLVKTLTEFDFAASPINQAMVHELHAGGFMALQRNAVFCGGTGTGKSHLAIAIDWRSPGRDCHRSRGAPPRDLDRQADLGSHRLMAVAAGALPSRRPLCNSATPINIQ